ncbi:MAG TPA: ROK family protein [Acidimicrobiales bacterium]|nr:ROK family protein [Acidimicrobiales bacterium]
MANPSAERSATTGRAEGPAAGAYAIASSTGVVRAINERAIYELVRVLGQASATQIGEETGLSRPTVALALANLEATGLLRQNGRRTGGVGRAPRMFEANPEAGHVLVVDVGRSWVRLAVANLAGDILVRRDVRSQVRSAVSLVEQIVSASHAVAEEAGVPWEALTHKVVGVPGVFEPETGNIRLVPNLPGWQRRGVGRLLIDRLDGNVTLYNDVNLAALGEQAYGAGRRARDFVYLSLGTGIGMGLVVGGKLRVGAHGAAGEVGFLPLFASGSGASVSDDVPRRAAERRRHGELESALGASALIELVDRRGIGLGSVSEVFDAARAGSASALEVVDEAASLLARAVGAVIATVDPELVILGGGIGHNGDLLVPRVREHLVQLVPLAVPEIVSSELGTDVSILGGISTALDVARRLLVERAGLAGASS